jgi:hypothetical protein
MKPYHWTNEKVIDFVNWFLDLHRLPDRCKLENMTILDSFKNGDDFKLWHKNSIEMDENYILEQTKNMLIELHNKLGSVGPDFNWNEFIDLAMDCKGLQDELKNKIK